MKITNMFRMFLMGILLVLFIRMMAAPFYHWCVNLYEDAAWIVETLRYGSDKLSWIDDRDLFENFRPYAGDNSSGMTDRILPE